MGLDSNIYRAKRVKDANLSLTKPIAMSYLDEKDYVYFRKDSDDHLHDDLIPYGTLCLVTEDLIDYNKIEADYNMIDMYITCITPGKLVFTGTDRKTDRSKAIDLTADELSDFYKNSQNTLYYVLDLEEVRYYRKEYEISNFINDLFNGRCENCGYYVIPKDFIPKINDLLSNLLAENLDYPYPYKPVPYMDDLVWHEWY